MRIIFIILSLIIYVNSVSAEEFSCTDEKVPTSIWNKFLPLITSLNTIEFVSFDQRDWETYGIFWKWIDLSTSPSGCPYEKSMEIIIAEDLKLAWSIIMAENSNITINEVWWKIKANILWWKLSWNEYPSYLLNIDTGRPQDDFFRILPFYPKKNPIIWKRYWQLIIEINWDIFLIWWKNNSWKRYYDLWKFYPVWNQNNLSINNWWQKIIDLSDNLNWFTIKDAYQLGNDINLIVEKNWGLMVYSLWINKNWFTKWSSFTKIEWLSTTPASTIKSRCNDSVCIIAVHTWKNVKIYDFKNWNLIKKTLIDELLKSQLHLTNDRIIIQNWNNYYSWTQNNWNDFIKFSLFWYNKSPETNSQCLDNTWNKELSFLDNAWNDAKLDIFENQTLTYNDPENYCFKSKQLRFETKDPACWNCVNMIYKCAKVSLFDKHCDWWKGYMRSFMPFKFVPIKSPNIYTQPIFTFAKNNSLNFTWNFDLWDLKIMWVYAWEEKWDFKWFTRDEMNNILNVKNKNIDLVKDNRWTSNPWDDWLKFKNYPSISINTWSINPWYVFWSWWLIDITNNEISRASFNYNQEFEPGHHTLHLVVFALNKNKDLNKTIRANLLYWFWWWFRAYVQWWNQKQDLDASAFWSDPRTEKLWTTKPDNYNIYYYPIVYDFYVPEITNFWDWEIKTLWGQRPIIKWVWAIPWSEMTFYSWYSKDISLRKENPDFSSLVAHSPRLNWMPQDMPIFSWNKDVNLPFVTIWNTQLSHKIRSWWNWEFSFKPVTSFPYIEWDILKTINTNEILKDYLTRDEKETYQISSQYLDDKWNLIWSKPIQFKMKTNSKKILFHHNINSKWEYETDSPKPILVWSYLPNRLIRVMINWKDDFEYARTDDKWGFQIRIKLGESSISNVNFYSYWENSELIWKIKILKNEKESPEIVFPFSWDQFYSRYIPILCNAKANSKVYLKFWIETLMDNWAIYWIEYEPQEISEIEVSTDSNWQCFTYSPFLKYIHEHKSNNSVYSLSASYKKWWIVFDRVSFRMRTPSNEIVKINSSSKDTYITPNAILWKGDDIELLSNGDIRFEFSKFKNEATTTFDFSSLWILKSWEMVLSPWVSILLPPLWSVEIIDFSWSDLMVLLWEWVQVIHKESWISNTVYNAWVYQFNWKFISKWDVIMASKAWALVDFITSDILKIKTSWKTNFIATFKNPEWKTYIETDKNIEYTYGASDLVINSLCDSAMKWFFENFEKQYNVEDKWISKISREDCLIFWQLSIDSDKSPRFIYPQPNDKIKSWEKFRITWYAWPWSHVKISMNWAVLWTSTSNSDWFFEYITATSLSEVKDKKFATLYLEDLDQTYTKRQKVLINIMPNDSIEYDNFKEIPESLVNNNNFYNSEWVYNKSLLNNKK